MNLSRRRMLQLSGGGFGALAEFTFDAGEKIEFLDGDCVGAVTARGAFRLDLTRDLKPVAYETLSKTGKGWGQGLVLCLPADEARMGQRTVVTELGPDHAAALPTGGAGQRAHVNKP